MLRNPVWHRNLPSTEDQDKKGRRIPGVRGSIITWCVGHLVTMSYPEEYDTNLKGGVWRLCLYTGGFKYEVIPAVSKQFRIVAGLLNREDVDTIYVCTDSGRRESISTVWWSSRQESTGKHAGESGSTLRQRMRY